MKAPEEAEEGHSSRGKGTCKGPEVRKHLRTVRQPAWLEWDELGKSRPFRALMVKSLALLSLKKLLYIFNPHPRTYSLILKREEGGERMREKNINVRKKTSLTASCTHPGCRSNLQPRYVL